MTTDLLKKHCDDIDKYTRSDPELVAAMLKTYRLVLNKTDTRLVACSDPNELKTIRTNFLKKKLELENPDDELDAIITGVCDLMKACRQKNRLTFYYLLVEATGSESVFV